MAPKFRINQTETVFTSTDSSPDLPTPGKQQQQQQQPLLFTLLW